ncbi:MAG: hypothetical protein C0399_04905 [Syntrophus sp. (in: bacteria)]|nr:hypothetical protein [Syntrophus sp. (in: bacteria)]
MQEVLTKFQDIKKFASEIHTEIHLIKPILKLLGYAYESKPKFFEEQIKGPDAALFANDEERVQHSPFWGTEAYYANTLGILLLKRYGRNLEEGISGFYLEFENRIPLYQTLHLLKKTKASWGFLTNGKHWILIKKPVSYEMRLISIDLENGLFENSHETLHLFFQIFSLRGLMNTLPGIMEQERMGLISLLREKKTSIRNALHGLKKKKEVFPKVIDIYSELFPDKALSGTERYLLENNIQFEKQYHTKPDDINEYNTSDISAYLFNKKGYQADFNLEDVLLKHRSRDFTKEDLLSLKILDMTPNFGNIASELIESIAYLSFILHYKEKNTFVAEWENEVSLKRYITDHLLFGIEKSYPAYDILHNMLKSRFKTEAKNYKFGNPLIGMSLSDVLTYFDTKNQPGLFSKNPVGFLDDFRKMFTHHFSLSEKIKEDLQIREELEIKLKRYTARIGDAMDIITSTYFNKSIDSKKIQDVLSNLDSDESAWSNLSSQGWFRESKGIAQRNGFFHFELEFPFLLGSSFDFIFVQPALQHIWEDAFPLIEVTKAYIKRGMAYLKPEGTMVIILGEHLEDDILQKLAQSKRYETEIQKGVLLFHKKSRSLIE